MHAFARDVQPDAIAADLHERWELDNVYFKLHAACAHCFALIDAALALREAIGGRCVRRAEVWTYGAAALLDHRTVSAPQEAKFSIPYCVAAALTLGRVTEDAFDPDHLGDRSIARLAELVEVNESPSLTADFPRIRGADLRLELEDGAVFEQRVDVPHGMPEHPARPEDLLAKFRGLVAPVLGSGRVEAIISAVNQIESLQTAELVRLAGGT